jgi:hypothetical protein
MDYRRCHFCLFGKDGMGQLESGEGRSIYLPAFSPIIIHPHICVQLFFTDLGMVSHHSEIKDCSFSIRNIEELVLFAIG